MHTLQECPSAAPHHSSATPETPARLSLSSTSRRHLRIATITGGGLLFVALYLSLWAVIIIGVANGVHAVVRIVGGQ